MIFQAITNVSNSLSRHSLLFPLAFLGLALLLPALGFGQNRQDLESRRKKLIREIEQTDRLLQKTTQSKAAALDRFVALQKQIERRESLIQTLNAEIEASGQSIRQTAAIIESLQRDVQVMQADYSKMLRSALRRKMQSNPLLYILSATDLNQAFRRWLFLRKYDQFRKTQAKAIADTQKMLARKIAALEASQTKQEALLATLEGQKTALGTELSDKEKLLSSLKKDESRLREDLKTKQAAHEALNQAIERIIQEEVNRQIQAARRPKPQPAAPAAERPATPAAPNPPKTAASDEAAAEDDNVEIPDDSQSQAFRQSRGRLPWPVANGFISRGFGRQKHPTLKNIEITNNGVDIRTEEGSAVHAVYGGKVAGVQFIPGHDYTVIIQHGNYYTVYSNLSETKLSKGDRVEARQTIGRVSSNPITGASELHFELWYQKQRLNPSGWIRKN